MLEAVLEKRPNLKPRNPFSLVGAPELIRFLFLLFLCVFFGNRVFFSPPFVGKGKWHLWNYGLNALGVTTILK